LYVFSLWYYINVISLLRPYWSILNILNRTISIKLT
jgi:hypothetical protein